MTCENEIHVDDIGTSFQMTLNECDVPVDIQAATVKEIIFKKPDKTVVTQTAEFLTDGSDGIIYYKSVSGDLDTKGTWYIQARVTMPSGTWSSDTSKFKVYVNL